MAGDKDQRSCYQDHSCCARQAFWVCESSDLCTVKQRTEYDENEYRMGKLCREGITVKGTVDVLAWAHRVVRAQSLSL